MEGQKGILFSYAHPDDEQGVTGTIMHNLTQGVRVGLICATRGEEGQIAAGVDATPDNLGTVREQEMRNAMEIVGLEHLWFLDYRDSGMQGTEANARSDAFVNAAAEEAVGRVVAIIRSFKPQLVVTFDPTGIYFHPDHVTISRVTTAAFSAAGDAAAYPDAGEPWQPLRLFYSVLPISSLRRMSEFFANDRPDSDMSQLDFAKMGVPDEQVTHRLAVHQYSDLKRRSLSAHASQMASDGPMTRLPEEAAREWLGMEHLMLVQGTPFAPDAEPNDLFAGL